MRNNFAILLIGILYFLTFFIFDNADINKINSVLKKADFEEITETISKNKEEKVKKDTTFEILKQYEKYYPKKFSYPKFFKKGDIVLYINNPLEYSSPSFSSRAEVCKVLINEINNSKKSVDFAIYGLNHQDEILLSLSNAAKRGIQIRGVSDSDERGSATYKDNLKLEKFSKITYDNSKYIMHNKFFIIDDEFLLTGSMNISNTGCGGYNSNSVLTIRDKDIVLAYKKEFEQMFQGKFKKRKKDYSYFKKDGEFEIGAYFSPSGNIYENLFSKEIKKAKKTIKISVFVLTFYSMKDDILEALERGVEVNMILDATGAHKQKKMLEELKKAGAKIKVENFGGKNHEKTLQIDDDVLILGSANFSFSAMNKNDENVVFIKDKDFAKFYSDYFDKLFSSINDIYLKRYPRAESFESQNSCFDKIDNNFDGKIDSYDKGCKI